MALLLDRGSQIYALRKLRLQSSGWQEVQGRPRHETEQSPPEFGGRIGSWHSSIGAGPLHHLGR